MDNYIEYKLSKVRARMKPEIVPHIFTFQPNILCLKTKRREFGQILSKSQNDLLTQ